VKCPTKTEPFEVHRILPNFNSFIPEKTSWGIVSTAAQKKTE
jgi:hypothetical protein